MNKLIGGIALVILAMAIGSTGLAINDDGGGGGGIYSERTPTEVTQLLRQYRMRREALCHAPADHRASMASTTRGVALTTEQEMLQLQQISYEAQRARWLALREQP